MGKKKKESHKTLQRGEGVVGKARGLMSSHIVSDLHPYPLVFFMLTSLHFKTYL